METVHETSPLAVIESVSGLTALLPPLRREIMSRLHEELDSASGLARRMGTPRQKLNYHVRALEREGLIELAGEEKRRGCVERLFRPSARAYLIQPDALGPLGKDPAGARDRFSSSYLILLGARLVRDVARLRRGADEAGQRLATLSLEVDLRFRTPAERTAFFEELAEAVARLAARYQDDSPESRAYRLVVGGHPAVKDRETKGET